MIINPKGIDLPIQEMQILFQNNLWLNIESNKKRFYHRVFRNMKNDTIRPEVFEEIDNNYKEVICNKRLSSLSWFDVESKTDTYNLGQMTHNVGVVFIVNLYDLFPNLSHRAVEESHLAVQKILLKRPNEFQITDIITGIEAYGDFDIENLKNPDMQPWHVFRFNCNVKYSLNC